MRTGRASRLAPLLAILATVAATSLLRAEDPPRPAPRIALGAWSGALKEHPRLFGPRAHLRSLAQSKAAGYKEISSTANAGSASPGDPTTATSSVIAHAVEGLGADRIKAYVDATLALTTKGATNEHQTSWLWLMQAAIVYDGFHDEIAPKDRERIVEWLNLHLASYKDDENAFHNSTLSKILCYLRVAYATWGENPRAKDFRDHAISKLYEGKVLPVLLELGAGGGYTECGWYGRGALWNLVQGLELARRLEGYDGFAKAPRFFHERLAYELHQPYPRPGEYDAEEFAVEGDGAYTFGGHREYPRETRMLLAQYFRGSELARFVAGRRRKGSNADARLMDFIYDEEPDPPQEIAGFKLSHLASGIGRVYARSDWTQDASWLRFECGPWFSNHQHFEVGNFEIFRREPLATESGEYEDFGSSHAVNWLQRTIAHNCVLVHDPGEVWKNLRDGGKNRYANDGGQTNGWGSVVDALDLWKGRRETFERGSILAYANHHGALYLAADCTKAYSPSKLSLWIRQIVFLRPHAFVIFDRVVSTQPDFAKTWLLHSRNEPEIKGASFSLANGKGKLSCETLLPEKAQVKKIEGYTYGGETFDQPKGSQTPLANRWRIEVAPQGARTEDLFLHVISTDEPIVAKLIRRGSQVGVSLPGGTEVVFDGKVGGTLATSGKKIALKAEIKRERWE